MKRRNPDKTPKKQLLRPAAALRLRIDEDGLLRARVSASAGEFNLSPEILHLLCLLQQGVEEAGLSARLRQDFRQLTAELPDQQEIGQILGEMQDAGCVVETSHGEKQTHGIADGFGDPWIQWAMLADQPRCSAYLKAIRASVTQTSHVMDVGAGTGLLSIYSLQAGAKRVDAIEETASAEIIRRMKETLPAADKQRLVIHNKNSFEVQPESSVTQVVSELFGNDPLQEGVVSTLRDIFSRINSTKVQGIPDSVEIYAQCIELTSGPLEARIRRLTADANEQTPDWQKPVRMIQNSMDLNNISFSHPIRKGDFKPISDARSAFKIPLAPPPSLQSERPAALLKIKIPENVRYPVILICFRAHLNRNVTISNMPEQHDQCEHWSPIIVPLINAKSGAGEIKVTVGVSEDWERVTVDVRDPGGQRLALRK
ncbi:MAG: hypothetical protein RLZZ488_1468 [Pseudomonadota bacterium]